MASKKKAEPKNEPADDIDDIPEGLAEEIQEAVAMEDEPSSQLSSTQIKITHYEDSKDESVEVGDVDAVAETEESVEDDLETDDPVDEPETVEVTVEEADDDSPDEEIEVEVADEPEEQDESATEDVDDEGESEGDELDVDDEDGEAPEEDGEDHEWHLIDDEDDEKQAEPEDDAEEVESDEEAAADDEETADSDEELQKAESETEEAERPEWDEEKWQQANAEDDPEEERPEWDEEKWQQANADEEEQERPDWDEEKWRQARAEESESEEHAAVEAEKSETADEKQEVEAGAALAAEADAESEQQAEDPDQMSASQAILNAEEEQVDESGSRFDRIKAAPARFVSWWQAAKLRNSMITAMALVLLIFVTTPSPRYAVLNTVGVRATASVAVIDAETQLPLREVKVSLSGKDALTNENGLASFGEVKLGSQELTVVKSAYDTYTQNVTIGVGDNSIEQVALVAVGTSFEFRVTDWLTGDPVPRAEVSFDENSAFVNAEGIAKLNTPALTQSSIDVTVSAPDYAEETITVNTKMSDPNEVELVLSRPHLFVSKRSGKYDIYKILADGSNEELLLEGTGNEKDGLRFDVSPSGEKAVLVATRDKNIQNEDGFVLSGLYVIDTSTGEFEKVDSSERIDIVGWIGSRVIYVKVQAGASGQNPERHRLVSLDTETNDLKQIAASNFFNDVIVANEYVFYAPSDAYKQEPKPYLFRANAEGSRIETVFEKTVWTVLRTGFDEIQFDSDQVWYSGEIDRIFNVEADSRPTNAASRLYSQSPNGQRAAWVDIRDGKGSLILTDVATGEEETLVSQGGLRSPIVWLSDSHIIYRIVTSTETADYVVNINGGSASKIRDVSDVSGADRWYYFY